jgi:thiamine-phosphate pyrophosphorylase
MRRFHFPSRLYPILDSPADPARSVLDLADALLGAGMRFLQLRVKREPTRRFVELARAVQTRAVQHAAALLINDRADIALLVGAAGVHLGQEDLPVADARGLLGPDALIGFSTHNVEQADAAANAGVADYIGFGPIFPTRTKDTPDPVQGLDGLRAVRGRVALPIVAIGGITVATAPAVIAAGADAVAVISDLVRARDVAARVAEYRRALGEHRSPP